MASSSRRAGRPSSAAARRRAASAAAACAWPAARVASVRAAAAAARRGLGVVPVAPDEERLGAAQRLGDLAVALGLAGLAGEAGELGVERFEDVGDAGEVGLGGAQLQLGLVAALVEAGDAGGLLEDAAAGLGAGVDQLGDLALADQRRRLGAGRGVGEEHGDVAGAGLVGR